MVINYTRNSKLGVKKHKFKIVVTQTDKNRRESSEIMIARSSRLKYPSIDWCNRRLNKWFHDINLCHVGKLFHNYNGLDLLRLTKSDINLICGESDGNKLINYLYNKGISTSKKQTYKKQLLIKFSYLNYYNLVYLYSADSKIEMISKIKNLLICQYFNEIGQLKESSDKQLEIEDNYEFSVCRNRLKIDDLKNIDLLYTLDKNRKLIEVSNEDLLNENKYILYLIHLKNETTKQSILLIKE
jgi:hypothetical protein